MQYITTPPITYEQQKELYNLSLATNSKIDIPAPKGLEYLPYQKAGIHYASILKNSLIADEPGLGKTIQALGFINLLNLRNVLIIVPASLVTNWQREASKWLVGDQKIYTVQPGKLQHNLNANIIIASYNMAIKSWFKSHINLRQFDALIIDEAHYLANPKTKTTKTLIGHGGFCERAKRVMVLTGTPIQNRPMDIYPLVSKLCPVAIKGLSWISFGRRYCAGRQFEVKGRKIWDMTGASNLKELGFYLRSHFMIRRLKKDVLHELPEKRSNIIFLKQGAAKNELQRLQAYSIDELINSESVVGEFGELAQLRRDLGVKKIDQAFDYIKTQLDCGHQKIVVFAHHKEVINGLLEKFKENKIKAVHLVGGMKQQDKQAAVDQFQSQNDVRIFLGSIDASGVGFTLTAASYVVFVEYSWIPGKNDQAIDRCHRIGQKNFVLAEFLVYEDSFDVHILKNQQAKAKNIKTLMRD